MSAILGGKSVELNAYVYNSVQRSILRFLFLKFATKLHKLFGFLWDLFSCLLFYSYLCNQINKRHFTMDKIFDITKASREEVTNVVNGMLNAKKEWLEMINKREKELGLA